MLRRRLRLSYPSDEDEEDNNRQQNNNSTYQQPTITHPPVSSPPSDFNPNPTSVAPEPISISDDDELIDVSDDLNPPSPPPPLNHVVTTGSPVGDFLSRMGLSLRREWLESCLHGLQISLPAFSSLDVAAKAKLCFEQFLFSDMNYSGGAVLPHNVASMHLVDLPGPFVLQVCCIFSVQVQFNVACLFCQFLPMFIGLSGCKRFSRCDSI